MRHAVRAQQAHVHSDRHSRPSPPVVVPKIVEDPHGQTQTPALQACPASRQRDAPPLLVWRTEAPWRSRPQRSEPVVRRLQPSSAKPKPTRLVSTPREREGRAGTEAPRYSEAEDSTRKIAKWRTQSQRVAEMCLRTSAQVARSRRDGKKWWVTTLVARLDEADGTIRTMPRRATGHGEMRMADGNAVGSSSST